MPTYAGIARVKNEADILEPFVRHHARLLDRLIVIDNGSSDASVAILEHLAGEGLPLTILTDDVIAYHQSEVMTYYSRAAFAQFGCDRLFLLDADEFIRVGSRAELELRLDAIPPDIHGLIPWMTYAPSVTDDAGEPNPVVRITHRRADEPPIYKLVLSSTFVRQADAIIDQGNHDVVAPYAASEPAIVPQLHLAHYPVRSVGQAQRKAAAGWNAYFALGGEAGAMGNQWRTLYEKLRLDPDWTADDITHIGATYPEMSIRLVRDPLPHAIEVKYDNDQTLTPLDVALDSARDTARLYAQACRTAGDTAQLLARVHDDVERLRSEAAAFAAERAAMHELVNATLLQTNALRRSKLVRIAVALTLGWRRLRERFGQR